MIKNVPTTLNTDESIKKYLIFKEQLLNRMAKQDPLQILQSNLFEKYQRLMFNLNHQQLKTYLVSKQSATIHQAYKTILDNNKKQMQSVIKVYNLDGMRVGVIEKRPHSCNNHNLKTSSSCNERVWTNKIRKMQQQSKIDLMIWSNIMYNHFRPIQKSKPRIQQEKGKQNTMSASNIKQGLQKSHLINNQSLTYTSLSSSQNQTQILIQRLCDQISQKPSKKNIKQILKQFFVHIEEQNEKTIGLLNRLRKQNDKLQRNVQQNSMKQLQYIVQLKHMEKRINSNEQEIKNMEVKIRLKQQQIRQRQGELNHVIRQKLKEIQYLQQQNIKRSSIQQLKQKMAIDSIRRTTLCTLSKQRFQIQLKKQELSFNIQCNNALNSTINLSFQSQISEETRCCDD